MGLQRSVAEGSDDNNLNTNKNGGMMKRYWRGLSNLPVFVEIKEVREGILLFNIFKLFP